MVRRGPEIALNDFRTVLFIEPDSRRSSNSSKGSIRSSRRSQDNRQLEISEISAGIKALAKELNIPIIVIAQLNRQPELRGNGKPRLSDLRESGSIEQDADVVSLLVRAEYYETEEEAKQEVAGEAELIIAKQRNGPIGDVPLVFLREFTRFESRVKLSRSNSPI